MCFLQKKCIKVCYLEKVVYLCKCFSGCSAVRLAHLLWEQGVVGSNPATPTNKISTYIVSALMVSVAQLVRVVDCGSIGRGFESHRSPKPDK